MQLKTTESEYQVHQLRFIEKIGHFPLDARFEQYQSLRASVAWANLTSTDIAVFLTQAAQVTEEIFTNDVHKYVERLNFVIEKLRKQSYLKLRFPNLDNGPHTWELSRILLATPTDRLNFDILQFSPKRKINVNHFSGHRINPNR